MNSYGQTFYPALSLHSGDMLGHARLPLLVWKTKLIELKDATKLRRAEETALCEFVTKVTPGTLHIVSRSILRVKILNVAA